MMRHSLQVFVRRWDAWWFSPVPPHTLALFRIVFGAFLLLYWGTYLPHVPVMFANHGLALPIMTVDDGIPPLIASMISPPPHGMAWVLYGALLLSFLLIALGSFLRSGCIVALLLHAYVWASSQHWAWFTMEQLSVIFLMMLLPGGADRALSLRMRRTRGSWRAWEPIVALPQRLLALQITVTLLGAGWLKVVQPDWQDGMIIAHAFMERWATPLAFSVARLPIPMFVYDGLAYALTSFEMALPFGLWTRWWKWFLAGFGFFLICNALLLSFWWFLVLLPCAIVFVEPEKIAGTFIARKEGTSSCFPKTSEHVIL